MAIGLLASTLAAQPQERSSIPDRYKWDLSQIFPSDEAWRAAKDRLVAEIPKIRGFKGTLGSSPQKLADALDLATQLSKDFSRIYVYASMKSDEDTRVSTYQGMQQEMAQLGATLGAETSFIEPEILKIDRAPIDKFLASEHRLGVYKFYLEDILRRRAHTLSDEEERLLASFSVISRAPSDVYGILSNADFP
jgi:oligoendopeptidase F